MYIQSIETTNEQASSIPVGAIAGGIAAGAFLAVILTLGWLKWGKRGIQQQSVRWDEAAEIRPASSEPNRSTHKPFSPYPTERKIKFEARSNNQGSESTSTVYGLPEVSKPRPLRSEKGSSRLSFGPRDRYFATNKLYLSKMAHKPSTVSSVSMYSTESGEEHQVRAPPNLILAATGGLNVDSRGGQRSITSSNWSLLSRMAHGVQGDTQRHNQTGTSAYTTISRDSSGAPIGIAL